MTREEMIQFIQTAPTYTEIRFGACGAREVHGIIRDLPGNPRRVTVTTTGTEFFVDIDTDIESLTVDYRYQCPNGHQWNGDSAIVCPSCGYMEDEGRGPISDHAAIWRND